MKKIKSLTSVPQNLMFYSTKIFYESWTKWSLMQATISYIEQAIHSP
jgi:hypothetical protein